MGLPMKTRHLLALLVSATVSLSAYAKVHVYEFTAAVSGLQYGNDTPQTIDSWVPGSAISLGDTITGRFSFDDAPLQNHVPSDPDSYSANGNGPGNAIALTVNPNGQSIDTTGLTGSVYAVNNAQSGNAFVQIARYSEDVFVYLNFDGGKAGQFSDPAIPFNLSLSDFSSGKVLFFWDTPNVAYIAAVGDISTLTNVTPVPEPSAYLMLVAGLAIVGAGVRRRRNASLHTRYQVLSFN